MSFATSVRMRLKQASYLILCRLFGFDRWHYRMVRENCRYFSLVQSLHRQLGAQATIEVGCGLGEIISGLQSAVRIGIDRDPRVIRAARLIRGGAIRFFVDSEFTRAELAADRGAVCLVFLNWFHVCESEEIRHLVGKYIGMTAATHVIFDVIHAGTAGYRYAHPAQMLAEFGGIVSVTDSGDDVRSIVVLRTV